MINNSKYLPIIKKIRNELMSCDLPENVGLHNGTSGIALFFAYYDLIINNKKDLSKRVLDILEHNIKCINSGNNQHSICNGISGFGWLCEHLKQLGMLKKDEIHFLDTVDPFLHKKMISGFQEGNYDFLHGALGIATYFLSRPDHKKVSTYLEDLLTGYEKTGISCENGAVKWMSMLPREGKKGYNISLSHGISSIAAFFIRLHQLNFETERVEKLLVRTIRYILDQITYTTGSLSYFPSYSKENMLSSNNSRLGWCYGDLGIAHVLWQAATILKDKELENTAIKILHHTTRRRDLQINAINDAGLCHGSSGVAYIFWNLFLNTGINEFRETTDYWLDITLEMAKYPDGLAGFKVSRLEEFGGITLSHNFLEGISGIGLTFISRLAEKDLAWDRCLMLS